MWGMRAGRWIASTAIAALLTACAGSGGGGGGTPKPSCKPPNPITVCFSSNIQPIFNRSCALGGCHAGTPAAQSLDLTAGKAYRNIFNVPAVQQPRLKLVKPDDPTNSYLLQKINGTPTISGVLMPQGCPGAPLNGAQCLSPDDIMAVQQWIAECATNPNPCP
jgi:hypothetical protein